VQEERIKLSDRLLNFSSSVIKLARVLRKGPVDNHLARQIVRSATSSGANYEEACSGESRADFIHKLQIALKELNETLYWLKLIEKSCEINATQGLKALIQENKELCAILARSVVTAKNRSRSQI
jgi:four helix bundle protein